MKKLYATALVLFLAPSPLTAGRARQDSVLTLIDRSIDESRTYVAAKERRMARLRGDLALAATPRARFETSFRLYEEYRPFVRDSALFFLDRCIGEAETLGDRSASVRCLALKSILCSSTGQFIEAMDILRDADTAGIGREPLATYYRAMGQACGEIAFYTPFADCRAAYEHRSDAYWRRFSELADPEEPDALLRREVVALNANRLDESMRINDAWMNGIERDSHSYALASLYRYLEFKARRDTAEMMVWLGESVLTDIRNGVMDQGSMWEMGNQLMLMGQVDRSYRYLVFTGDCAQRFGSRQRLSQISPLLTIIAQRYKERAESSQARLMVTIGIISTLGLILAALLCYVGRQRDRLRGMSDTLARQNDVLERLNESLQTANAHLTEANRVKDEYVGRFMNLCSRYVERFDQLRKKVRNRLKKGQMAELVEMTRSEEFNADYTEELYDNFDDAFLKLFPDFVERFNALLRPDSQVKPPQSGRLNTTLRIFALVRLGISDSGKISEILHYSTNTIYNYRAQVKKGALGGKADFEKCVMEIE